MARLNKKKIAELADETEQENGSPVPRDESEVETGDEREKKDESNDEGSDDDYAPRKNGGGSDGKKASKRANDESSDDEPLNKKGKPSKAAAIKGKAKGKKGAAKAKAKVVEDEEEAAADDGEVEYEVQEIVDHKIQRGTSLYLVRWKGFSKDDDTWEPEESLSCPDKIDAFNRKRATADKKTNKKIEKPAKKGRGAKATLVEDPDKEYEVEKIIDYSDENNVRQFRIRWKGYAAKHDTWEPEENLECKDLIDKFMAKMDAQKNISFKELREEPKKPKRLANETINRTGIYSAASTSGNKRSKRGTAKKSVYYGESDD